MLPKAEIEHIRTITVVFSMDDWVSLLVDEVAKANALPSVRIPFVREIDGPCLGVVTSELKGQANEQVITVTIKQDMNWKPLVKEVPKDEPAECAAVAMEERRPSKRDKIVTDDEGMYRIRP